jgi:hypothetical protein
MADSLLADSLLSQAQKPNSLSSHNTYNISLEMLVYA